MPNSRTHGGTLLTDVNWQMSKWQFVPTLNTENEDGDPWIPKQVLENTLPETDCLRLRKMMVGSLEDEFPFWETLFSAASS